MQDLHNDIAAVNHNGANYELGRGTNCMYCTTAYEMRRRGYDVQAQQDWVGGILHADMPDVMFEGAKTEALYDISGRSLNDPSRLADSAVGTQLLMETVEAQGEGARGYIGVYWNEGGGHSMAYEVVDGQMHLIDCQTGEDLTGDDIWYERMIYADSCYITRVDNCEVNKYMVDRYIEDAGTEDSSGVMDEMLDHLIDKLKKKKKKKKNKGLKKQVNRYGIKLNSMWNSTKRVASNRSRSFVNNVKDVI